MPGDRPLSALLSQVLVAFTIEFDNEFERRMSEAGHPGARLSLVIWSNLMRFLSEGGTPVRDVAAQALAPEKRVKFELGCLERWGFVVLQPDSSDDRRILRDGWGSARGIRCGWLVRLTGKGRKAREIWPPLFGDIERRWQARFGEDEIGRLRQALDAVAAQLAVELPEAPLPLPVLLSQLLLAFTIEFDRESRVPLALCANALRVLGDRPIPVGDLPRLTGTSPETSDIGWQIKPYVTVEPDPVKHRGKLVRLTPLGLKAQQTYRELTAAIEKRWQERFGKSTIDSLRESLWQLLTSVRSDRLLLSEGLVPAEGTVRAGEQAPALGRRDVGAAARQRMRDLVAQTEMFLRDPANTLPHYPLWDMNRGFGP